VLGRSGAVDKVRQLLRQLFSLCADHLLLLLLSLVSYFLSALTNIIMNLRFRKWIMPLLLSSAQVLLQKIVYLQHTSISSDGRQSLSGRLSKIKCLPFISTSTYTFAPIRPNLSTLLKIVPLPLRRFSIRFSLSERDEIIVRDFYH
jgi:hypothetical protein